MAKGRPYRDLDAEVEEMPGYEPEILPTYREQVVKARRGQGVFRSNVLLTEKSCRVTRVSDPKHLRASHIKPWRAATDAERLSGFNGLLLSPHIDHLFDKGHISFSIDRRLLVAEEVERDLLDRWGIDRSTNVGDFNHDQQAFLEHHRVNISAKASAMNVVRTVRRNARYREYELHITRVEKVKNLGRLRELPRNKR